MFFFKKWDELNDVLESIIGSLFKRLCNRLLTDPPAIRCPSPLPPHNGRLLDSGRFFVGHTVQYVCDDGFVLIGEPVIRCTEEGIWSHATPFCKRACRFPGDPGHGRITPVKFLYEIGDRILVQCNPGEKQTNKQTK